MGNLKGISPRTVMRQMKQIDGVELSPAEYDKYVQLMGKPLKGAMDSLFQSDEYKNANYGDGDFKGRRQEMAQHLITSHKMEARRQLLMEHPELQEKIALMHQKKLDARTE
jgi:hypothetical protein